MNKQAQDNLFKKNNHPEEFIFNDQVAGIFDDMLSRSVPCYQQVLTMVQKIIQTHCQTGDLIYDLGCSTGSSLLSLASLINNNDLNFIGVDSSEAMIHKARRKAGAFAHGQKVEFTIADITDFNLKSCGVIILNYTLQFLRPPLRHKFICKLFSKLRPGGILIVSEKVISHSPKINRSFIDYYLRFKLDQGYSELEISRKREALENILIPFSIKENILLLNEAGFQEVESFFQWFNFSSFLAIKSE